ncbi:sensor domain-containing diguanylate cyclase [Oceanobacillus manasiensis]|uniref:sensor domain-containing diguanylate cyclase n=1 Tax=Oceanobacillus manasiensis TaxID=586413 RepID=UPI0005A78BB2|nr:sensor domain-containing diguanylate cyclase [Oceanobacillus manasiensis]
MFNLQFATGFLIAMIIGITLNILVNRRNKRQQVSLTEEHNRIVHLIETPNDFIYYAKVVPEVKFEYLSPSAENFFGKGSNVGAYLDSKVAFNDIHPDDYGVLIKKINGDIDYFKPIIQRWKDKDGNYRWFEEYATPTYANGKLVALQGVLRNIDDRIVLQEKLNYQLYHDTLTDIYNRAHFELVLKKYNEEINRPVAIILCDLDDLKFVNDNYGHKQGDVLIKGTAELLNHFSSHSITVARIGGDEFILFVERENGQEIDNLVKKIRDKVDYNNKESNLKIRLSIGYAFTSNSQGEMTRLFSQADQNMYLNKSDRKIVMT